MIGIDLVEQSLDLQFEALDTGGEPQTHNKFGRDGTGQVSDPLSILVGDKCRHGSDVGLLCNLLSSSAHVDRSLQSTDLLGVDVNLDKVDAWVLILHLGKVWADHLAWTTPSRPKIDDDRLVSADLFVSSEVSMIEQLTRVLNSSYEEISLTMLIESKC